MVAAFRAELCTRCHAFTSTNEYPNPFANDSSRAFTTEHSPSILMEGAQNLDADIAAVSAELKQLTAVVNSLRRQRNRLRSHKRRLSTYAIPSLIRRFPTELLSIIFTFACDSVKPDLWETALAISHTCYKWRNISLSMPALWTNIYVGPDAADEDGGNEEVQRLPRLYIQRALGLPLSLRLHRRSAASKIWDPIDIDSSLKPVSPHSSDSHILLKDIFRFSEQLKHLELQVHIEDLINIIALFGNSTNFHFPLLESLSLAIDCTVDHDVPFITSAFPHAPRLSTVVIVDYEGNSLEFLCAVLPWKNIMHVTINSPDISELYDVLDNPLDRTIVWERVAGTEVFDHGPDVTSLVVCPSLWTWDLTDHLLRWPIAALRDLTLTELGPAVPPGMGWGENPVYSLPWLPNASLKDLRSLRIVMSSQLDEDDVLDSKQWHVLVETLTVCRMLKTLQIIEGTTGGMLTDYVFTQIMERDLVPELESIELVWAEKETIPEESLLSMLKQRTATGAGTLKSVVLGVREGERMAPRVCDFMQLLRTEYGVQASLW